MDEKRMKVAESPAGKEAYRTKQRQLSWPEKVRAVVGFKKSPSPSWRRVESP